MPSFWEHTRLDVLHVPGVATRVSTRSIAITCAPTSLAAPTAAAALPRSSLLPYQPQSNEQDRTRILKFCDPYLFCIARR